MNQAYKALLVLCGTLLAGVAAAQPAVLAVPPDAVADSQDTPKPSPVGFKNEADKLSYALGVSAATQLRKHGLEVDTDLYSQGLRAGLSGTNLLMTVAEASNTVAAKQSQVAAQQRAAKTPDLKQSAAKNKAAGQAFLADNASKEGVVTLKSGLQYKVITMGDGEKPKLEDTVICHYRGTLINGTEFDSSYKRNLPATFPVRKVIKGWTEALQLMPVGSKWQLFIPPHLAYGPRGASRKIPPNATLAFELELLSIDRAATGDPQPITSDGSNSGMGTANAGQSRRDQDQTGQITSRPSAPITDIKVNLNLDPQVTKGLQGDLR